MRESVGFHHHVGDCRTGTLTLSAGVPKGAPRSSTFAGRLTYTTGLYVSHRATWTIVVHGSGMSPATPRLRHADTRSVENLLGGAVVDHDVRVRWAVGTASGSSCDRVAHARRHLVAKNATINNTTTANTAAPTTHTTAKLGRSSACGMNRHSEGCEQSQE
jgi:hypothetical protein